MTSLVSAISSTLGEYSAKLQGGFLFQNEAVSHSNKEVRESRDDIDGMLQPLSLHYPFCNYYFIIISIAQSL